MDNPTAAATSSGQGSPARTAADVGPEPFAFAGSGGLVLRGDRRGDPTAPPVIFLHGGGQTRHSWGGTATAVAAHGWQAITLDARGHGESDWSPDGDYRLTSFARDLQAAGELFDVKPIVVGASLGGLTAMLFAGEMAPNALRALILVDIVPDMERDGADRIHAFMTDRLADGFGSLDEVADAIAAYNPNRRRPSDLSGLRKNLRERDGRWYWHWDPKFVTDAGDQAPNEIADVPRLEAAVSNAARAGLPMMLVRGRSSDLVTEHKAQEFVARHAGVHFVDVSGAGHMVAGDRNDAFTQAVLAFVDGTETSA